MKTFAMINKDNYLKKLDTLKFFVENQQSKGNIRDDISAGTIAQLLNAIYTDISMQLIIGMDTTRFMNPGKIHYQLCSNKIIRTNKKH